MPRHPIRRGSHQFKDTDDRVLPRLWDQLPPPSVEDVTCSFGRLPRAVKFLMVIKNIEFMTHFFVQILVTHLEESEIVPRFVNFCFRANSLALLRSKIFWPFIYSTNFLYTILLFRLSKKWILQCFTYWAYRRKIIVNHVFFRTLVALVPSACACA